MKTALESSATSPSPLRSDNDRWQAVQQRDPEAVGRFVYAVRTTGIYCHPDCPSRRPLRKNVRFFETPDAAEIAGFRACRRCRPQAASLAEQQAAIIAQVCRQIEASPTIPSLKELAEAADLSVFHLHRLFKAQTGVTPRNYAVSHRTKRLRKELMQGNSVTDAVYAAGYSSSGRFYEASADRLGMTPTEYRSGGRSTVIRFALGQTGLGAILVAATAKGICSIQLGDDPDALLRELQDRFPNAEMVGGDPEFEAWVAAVVGFVADPSRGLHLPLDIRGTAFQQRVWEALQRIPAGSTVSYAKLAEQIGCPASVRAVASACAANRIAVAIPCHRVVRTDGSLSGYRWGVERKRELIRRERQAASPAADAGDTIHD